MDSYAIPFLLLIVLCAFAAELPAAVNRLHLRGEDNLADSSGAGKDGHLVGDGVSFDRGVVDGRAFRFDGSGGHIAIDHGGAIDLRSSFTLSFWIKLEDDAINGVVFAEGIVDRRPSGRAVYIDSDRINGDGLVTYHDTGIGALSSQTPIKDGAWHHVAVTVDYDALIPRPTVGVPPFLETNREIRGLARIFIDGRLDAATDAAQGLDVFRLRQGQSNTLTIGGTQARFPDTDLSRPQMERNDFRGLLDDVQLFEGALSDQHLLEVMEAERTMPITCPPDDSRAESLRVERILEHDGRPVPANTFRATAEATDDGGAPLLFTFTLEQLAGARVRHMTPREIGPKSDQEQVFTVPVGNPPQDDRHVLASPGNVALFRNLPAGRWRVVVEVTDADNLLCKDQVPSPQGLEDNTLESEEFVVESLPDFVYAVSSHGNGKQLWYQAEDVHIADGLFGLGDAGGWGVIAHPAAFGSEALTRVPGASELGTLFGCGESGGRLVYRFDLELAGLEEGLHFFWGRTINAFRRSEFGAVPGDPDDRDMPLEPFPDGSWPGWRNDPLRVLSRQSNRIFHEDGNWGFAWQNLDRIVRPQRQDEGHAKVLQDGVNEHHIYDRQGCAALITDVYCWTDDPLYLPTDQDLLDATILQPFVRGDCNGDGRLDLSDGITMLSYTFLGTTSVACDDACDFNAEGELSIAGAVFLFTALFRGGIVLPPPVTCGFAAPTLGCAEAQCTP